jgi:hypothetical protein
MRVERQNSSEWQQRTRLPEQVQKVPLCPACGAQGLELRQHSGHDFLCISCNHTWGR